jgi:CDP-paratose 2-epimerase
VRPDAKVLITGGAGFIGTNIADCLLSLGRQVRIYDSLARAGTEQNLRWLQSRHGGRLQVVKADIREVEPLRRAAVDADTVFHFAAQVAVTTSLGRPDEDFTVNAGGTLKLLEILRERGGAARLVFTSTNKVYGELDDIPLSVSATRYYPMDARALTGISEVRALSFRSPYGCSKGAADQYVLDYARSYGLPAIVFRMSCIYGPHQHGTEDQGWVAHFLIRAAQDRPIAIYGDGRQVRDLLHVQDLARALLSAEQCLPALAGEAFNIGGGPANTVSLNELIDYIAELRGVRPRVEYDNWRVGDQRWYVSDCRKFARATGWRPMTSVADGVRQLHDWLTAEYDPSPELYAAAE